MDWVAWAEAKPERLRRAIECLNRLDQPGGIDEEISVVMLAVHMLEAERKFNYRFPRYPILGGLDVAGPFLPGATPEHRAAAIVAATLAMEFQPDISLLVRTMRPGPVWQCKMCKALVPGRELLSLHVVHLDRCPVQLAMRGRLAPAVEAQIAPGDGRETTWLRTLHDIMARADYEGIPDESGD